jgi:AcrR family transcriptional regulator
VTTSPVTRRRRGRPRAVERTSDLEPREEILRHAAALFSTTGVGATRIADIAASVGMTAPAIYHYFDNLGAIVEALLSFVVEESAAYATAVANRPGPCADRLHSLIRQHVERLTSGPYDLWFVAGLSESEGRRHTAVRRRATQWRRAVSRLVANGIDAGEFCTVDVHLAVAVVSGVVYGALQLRHTRGAVDAGAVATLAVRALMPDPARPTSTSTTDRDLPTPRDRG